MPEDFASSSEYDKLHKDIGADKLDKGERKKLFEKFVDHGGEIKKPAKEIKTSSKKTKSKKSVELKEKVNKKRKAHSASSKSAEEEKSKDSKIEISASFFDRLSLHLNAYFSGVVPFFGKKIKGQFIEIIKTDLDTELFNLLSVVIFLLNPKKGNVKLLRGMMIQENIYLYELLRLLAQLYQKEDFELLKQKTASISGNVDFLIVEEPIRRLFRKLYLFWPHVHQIRTAIEFGINMHVEVNKLDAESQDRYLKKGTDAIHFIFETFFLKLHYAYCKIHDVNIFIHDQDKLNQLLQIQNTEMIEYLIQEMIAKREDSSHDKEEMIVDGEKVVEEEEKEEEQQEPEFNEQLQVGRELISSLDFSKENTTDKDSKFYFDVKDKIFMVYVILEEFEKEFSFILTSNKIQFNVDWFDNKKMDAKKELNDLYIALNACHDNIKDYIERLKQINQIENNASLSFSQKNNQLHKLTLNQTRISNITRTRLLDISRSLERILNWISEKSETIIQNNNVNLHFDTLDGKKKVEGKTPAEIISLCGSFISYLKYLLEEGKLYGSSLTME